MEINQESKIVPLVDASFAVPTLSRWFINEWSPWYGPDGKGDAAADLEECLNTECLPVAVVALGQDNTVMGTAALKAESLGSELGFGPWLAAILVADEFRRKGIGTALIAAIELEAQRLGFQTIYTSTDAAKSILEKRGWKAIDNVESLRGEVTVMRLELPG